MKDEDRPQIFRGHGQSREERKATDQARIEREKLLAEAGHHLSDDDLRAIIANGGASDSEPLLVLDGVLRKWETHPAFRRGAAAAEIRVALGEHLERVVRSRA